MNMIAIEKMVIFMVEPDRWIVAHSGITKSATALDTPLFFVLRRVTGMVAAEDEVPSAVA